MHAWRKAQKAAYNKEYYRKNKDYWVRYYHYNDIENLGDNKYVQHRAYEAGLSSLASAGKNFLGKFFK